MSHEPENLLGAHGHGIRKLPSLATNLALMRSGADFAAPYVKHIGLAAPYLSASPPDLLPGLLLPSISTPKPPAARKAPTRVNLFKAQKTVAINDKCNACSVVNGTIIVFFYGSVPPTAYLCYTAMQGQREILIPYDTIKYQVDPATQFTYAMNAAASISFEITSLAANKPLNGQMTAAHVMDIDDIDIYSSGSYELRSTTPNDAVSSVSLANGLIGIMGPESWSETLLHPNHCGSKTYPGWSYSIKTDRIDSGGNATIYLDEITDHRWFTDTTIEVTVRAHFPDGTAKGGTLGIYMGVVAGACPPKENCDAVMRQTWATASTYYDMVGMGTAPDCDPKSIVTKRVEKNGVTVGVDEKVDRIKKFKEDAKKKQKVRQDLLCKKPDDKDVCEIQVTDPDTPCEGMNKEILPLCCNTTKKQNARIQPGEGGYTVLTAKGEVTICALEQPVYVLVEWDPCKNGDDPPKCYEIHIRTRCRNPEAQFGPAFIGRLEGLTDDVVVQINIRAAIAGIQSGSARAVAPPSVPSRLGLGEEDSVLTQAVFDSDGPISRVMTGKAYLESAGTANSMTREDSAGLMEAAPIGDTIRSITGTLQGIGKGLGGPFNAIGDIIGTGGNILGGIGDAISSIFSAPAPKRLKTIHAAPSSTQDPDPTDPPIYAAPLHPLQGMNISDFRAPNPPSAYKARPGQEKATKQSVKASMKQHSWSASLDQILLGNGPFMGDCSQAFPWVEPASDRSGIASIFVTSEPMDIQGRRVRYVKYEHSDPPITYYIDENLVTVNKPEYIAEVLAALVISRRDACFLTTDALNNIYGDSFAMAILLATHLPTYSVAVTGGISLSKDGNIVLKPVGEIIRKLEATTEAGMTLIAPAEDPLLKLRSQSAGTPIMNATDVVRGTPVETPSVIYCSTFTEALMMSAFCGRTSSKPFSQQEIEEKEKLTKASKEAQLEVEDAKEKFSITDKTTPDELNRIQSAKFNVNVPGFGIQEVPLFDPNWWAEHEGTLYKPASDKGLGLTRDAMARALRDGNIRRLRGLAIGILSRTLAEQRRLAGGRRKTPKTTTYQRQAPYKRPQKTQITALIQQLRGKRPAESQIQMEQVEGPALPPDMDQS